MLILFSSIYVAGILVFGSYAESARLLDPIAPKAAAVAVVILTSLIAMGLYQFHQRLYFREAVVRLLVGLAIGCLALAILFYALPTVMISRDVASIAVGYALVLLIGVRFYFVRTVDENMFRRRTLIFGAGDRAAAIQDLRRRADRRGFKIVGQVAAPGDKIAVAGEILKTNGKSITDFAFERGAEEIVVALDDRRGNLPVRDLLNAKLRGIDVIDLMEFLERESGKIRVDLVNPGWLVFSPGFRMSKLRKFNKRLCDLAAATVLLFFAWPVMLFIALAIKLEDGPAAPVFYRQVRVGRGEKNFEVLKFRSMRTDAEADGNAVWASKNDSRITKVGNFLRVSRLDELPQVLNVLRGNMSLVGPRPERPEFVANLEEKIPYYAERHTVKPGVTGWAQLRYSYGASEEDAVEKLQYDLYYIKNQNFMLDVIILLQTVEVVLWGKGAR
ncbi:MAG: TIGR03013 family PEP-CTERM/XrtA system glycosyltransferase [Gammaproteobacteria bacterium]|nr:TIGR03013 family PEP-CTERM/XrtA system glycosyltransferase [Gammaproteobacteria bacterium]MDH5239233.1 TIGR03013 family PEP-CTERM/XrtA system glycosyltransferase [Gammaproteobacteria bacterium]MDH5259902.1 TIGR03013 family PEP-CTERM/XrtA system glycosyltransferase [Gammaproteobacteria bacterium]